MRSAQRCGSGMQRGKGDPATFRSHQQACRDKPTGFCCWWALREHFGGCGHVKGLGRKGQELSSLLGEGGRWSQRHGKDSAAALGASGDRKPGRARKVREGRWPPGLHFIHLVEVRPSPWDGKGVQKRAVRVWSPSCLTNPERGCLWARERNQELKSFAALQNWLCSPFQLCTVFLQQCCLTPEKSALMYFGKIFNNKGFLNNFQFNQEITHPERPSPKYSS